MDFDNDLNSFSALLLSFCDERYDLEENLRLY